MSNSLTMNDVATKMHQRLNTERMAIMEERCQLQNRLKELEARDNEITLEYMIINEGIENQRGIFATDTKPSTVDAQSRGFSIRQDRIDLRNAINRVFEEADRQLKVNDIIDKLGEYDYRFNNYHAAYFVIITQNKDLLEPAGKRGFYQLKQD